MKSLLLCTLALLGLAGCETANTPEAIDAAREECSSRGGLGQRWVFVNEGTERYNVDVLCADGTRLRFSRKFKES